MGIMVAGGSVGDVSNEHLWKKKLSSSIFP